MMKSWIKILLFLVGGAALGYVYYLLFGCNGTCPITSSPYRTMAYFSVVGLLISGLSLPEKKKEE